MKPKRIKLPLIAWLFAVSLILPSTRAATFAEDTKFLRAHTEIILLHDREGAAQVGVAPAWQGRVMTSSAAGDSGLSFGWINRELITSGKVLPHMNAYGGEDRFWMGPEGGQFSIFFEKGAPFDFAHWFTPAVFDTLPFKVVDRTADQATFGAKFTLTNYSGRVFEVEVARRIQLIDPADVWRRLGVSPPENVQLVAFETNNQITNAGKDRWTKETGLLSVWILGMFSPTPATTIVVPIKTGSEAELGVRVTADYFGSIPSDRLQVRDNAIFLAADGRFRSKIGINPKRSKGLLGSFDAEHGVLTLVQFSQPEGVTDYVNSLWKLQENPYAGDAANSYNDGPPSPGAKPLGPFYELESSSPAAALAPGQSLTHTHRTFHLTGSQAALDAVARATLGVSLAEIQNALPKKTTTSAGD